MHPLCIPSLVFLTFPSYSPLLGTPRGAAATQISIPLWDHISLRGNTPSLVRSVAMHGPRRDCLVSLSAGTWIIRRIWLASVRRDWGLFTLSWVIIVVLIAAFCLALLLSSYTTLWQERLLHGALCAIYCLNYRHIGPWCPAVTRPLPTCWMIDLPPCPYSPH